MSSSGSPLMGNIVDYLFEPSLGGELESRAFLAAPTGDVSFGQLYARVCQVGNMLKGIGVEPGDRVLFSVLDGVDFLALFLGAIKIGAVGLPINTFLTAKDYEYYIRDSGAKAVITDQSVAPLIATITQRQPIDARVFIVGDDKCGFESFEEAMHGQPVDVPTYLADPMTWPSGSIARVARALPRVWFIPIGIFMPPQSCLACEHWAFLLTTY